MYNYSNKKTNRIFGDIQEQLELKGIYASSKYVKLANQINRDNLCEPIEKAYSLKSGRKSINVRMMLGLEILKHMLCLSDEKLVHQLQANIEMQYFCGIDNMYENTSIEPSSLTHFRNRLAEYPEIKEEIQNTHLTETIRMLPKKNQREYDQDSTVVNESVKYPHDVAILNDLVQKGANLIKKCKIVSGKVLDGVFAKGSKLAKKLHLKYSFSKGKFKGGLDKARKGMLKFSKNIIEKAEECYDKIKHLKHEGKSGFKNIKEKIVEYIDLGKRVVKQQKEVLYNSLNDIEESVKNRIVSFSKPYVRAIMKGKVGKSVQFGAKAQIGMIGRRIAVSVGLTRDNEHDSKKSKKGVEIFKKASGKLPTSFGYDKGGRSQEVYGFLKENKILNGIQGSKEYEELPKQTKKRLYNRRAFNENVINDVLNNRGVNCNRYSQKNTEWSLFMGCMTSNFARVW